MRIVKLDAVDSTNDYLKSLCRKTEVPHFTIVAAESQTAGRGQMGEKWVSEPSKNLTVSLLLKNAISGLNHNFQLNMCLCLAIANALEEFKVPDVSIKWPNDIMSGDKKVGGILIENLVRPGGEIWSVAGFGVNVNQQDFEGLPRASSLLNVTGREFDRDEVLKKVITAIEAKVTDVNSVADIPIQDYLDILYRKDIETEFSGSNAVRFKGTIRNVTGDGKLEIEIQGSGIKDFSLKEIEMIY